MKAFEEIGTLYGHTGVDIIKMNGLFLLLLAPVLIIINTAKIK